MNVDGSIDGNVARSVEIVIPAEHACYPHHFPAHTLVPGYLLLELICEALGALGMRTCGMRTAKFLLPVYPGEQARLVIEKDVARVEVALQINGQLRMSARFKVVGFE